MYVAPRYYNLEDDYMYSEKIKTLDLNAFTEKTLEIKMVDGRVINVKRPTKAIFMLLQAAQEADQVEDKNRISEQVIVAALNNNLEGLTIDNEEINAMPVLMKSAILKAYFDFLHELVSDPNSQSPQCQTGTKKQARKSRVK